MTHARIDKPYKRRVGDRNIIFHKQGKEVFPETLDEIQKLELFLEKQDKVPIADFIAFFDKY